MNKFKIGDKVRWKGSAWLTGCIIELQSDKAIVLLSKNSIDKIEQIFNLKLYENRFEIEFYKLSYIMNNCPEYFKEL